jgi:hypothetical protein
LEKPEILVQSNFRNLKRFLAHRGEAQSNRIPRFQLCVESGIDFFRDCHDAASLALASHQQ